MDDLETFIWETVATFWSEEVRELLQQLPQDELLMLFSCLNRLVCNAPPEARRRVFEAEARGEGHFSLQEAVSSLLIVWEHLEWSDAMWALDEHLEEELRFFLMMREK